MMVHRTPSEASDAQALCARIYPGTSRHYLRPAPRPV